MATCKDCLHFDLCECVGTTKLYPTISDGCRFFKDRSRFVELPCKPWDKAWVIDRFTNTICDGAIVGLKYNGFTTPQEWIEYKWESPVFGESATLDRIDLCLGKKVFLSREEAEKALAERSSNG